LTLLVSLPILAQRAPRVPLREPFADVMAMYDRLSERDEAARQEFCAEVSASMKADLWTVHLAQYLDDHPELTASQQAIIHQALGLIATGIFERDMASKRVEDQLLGQIKAHFTPPVARDIFMRLGPSTRSRNDGPGRRIVTNALDCDCSTESDWCDTITNPNPKCKAPATPQGCTPRSCCCGTLWLYSCDGLCS
jgi:hypothetical protein